MFLLRQSADTLMTLPVWCVIQNRLSHILVIRHKLTQLCIRLKCIVEFLDIFLLYCNVHKFIFILAFKIVNFQFYLLVFVSNLIHLGWLLCVFVNSLISKQLLCIAAWLQWEWLFVIPHSLLFVSVICIQLLPSSRRNNLAWQWIGGKKQCEARTSLSVSPIWFPWWKFHDKTTENSSQSIVA